MSRVVVLDTGPVGLLSHPSPNPAALACINWAQTLTADGARLVIPEIADYELRRELTRAGRVRGLASLDGLGQRLTYLSLTTPIMRHAAQLWAQARNRGTPTAGDPDLDGDVILAAQALAILEPDFDFVVATTNVKHLAQFVAAAEWHTITAN